MKIAKVYLMPRSIGNPLFPEMDGPKFKGAEITSAKTSAPEFTNSASQGQRLPSSGTSGHLVYVRRKPEVESSKSSGLGTQSVGTDVDPGIKSSSHDEAFKCNEDLKVPENKRTKNDLSPSDFSPHITGADPLPADKKTVNFKQLHERYCHLQDVLRELDQSNQDEYIQILRSLSSVELSRHAVDLEKRSIQLTFEEAKELQRAFAFNVLDTENE